MRFLLLVCIGLFLCLHALGVPGETILLPESNDIAAVNNTVKLKCTSTMGKMSHYYHFLLNCLLPSMLFKFRHPTKEFELCNPDLFNSDFRKVYSAVLPEVVVNPNASCSKTAAELKYLDGYDSKHGSSLLKLKEIERRFVMEYIIAQSPAELKKKYNQTFSREHLNIVVISRMSATHKTPENITSTSAAPGSKEYFMLSGAERRSISNIREVETVLRKEFVAPHKVIVAYLENMTVFEQFWLFHTASVVVGQHGAGLANIIFVNHQRFIGMLEISAYVADRSKPAFRPYSQCFQYAAQAVNTRYIRILQYGGEHGHVNVTHIVDGIRMLNASAHIVGSAYNGGDDGNTTVQQYDDDTAVMSARGIHVTKLHAHVQCQLEKNSNNEAFEFTFNCLLPLIVYTLKRPQLRTIAVCGVSKPYMAPHLRSVLPLLEDALNGCDLDVHLIRQYLPTHDFLNISRQTRDVVRSHLLRMDEIDMKSNNSNSRFAIINATNVTHTVLQINSSDIVLLDSSSRAAAAVSMAALKEPRDNVMRNYDALSAALQAAFAKRLKIVNVFALTPAQRAIVYSNASIVIAHQGVGSAYAIFAQNHTHVVHVVPHVHKPISHKSHGRHKHRKREKEEDDADDDTEERRHLSDKRNEDNGSVEQDNKHTSLLRNVGINVAQVQLDEQGNVPISWIMKIVLGWVE